MLFLRVLFSQVKIQKEITIAKEHYLKSMCNAFMVKDWDFEVLKLILFEELKWLRRKVSLMFFKSMPL